ncbi:hypothetical protein [Paenibacillus contaminans]|uniref:Uncharacterized protein n=1 Tax=Paenibacillus contaminans TaxID=450362 RepID=A0A329MSW8_9BACL|nr:hypothetical protein [Paenibacillus contaminans]RAV22652.1 hypothetical protein DQG23_00075 [Paenibacillus contaminans]
MQNILTLTLLDLNYYIKVHTDEKEEIQFISLTTINPLTMQCQRDTFFDLDDFRSIFIYGKLKNLWKEYQDKKIENKSRVYTEINEAKRQLNWFVDIMQI